MYDPYWKNNGPRSLQFHHNLSPIQSTNPNNVNFGNNDNMNDNNVTPFVGGNVEYKHVPHDSTELNMLPMIKEDPTTNRIYRASRVVHNQHSIRGGHKRSASMSVVTFSYIQIFIFFIFDTKQNKIKKCNK